MSGELVLASAAVLVTFGLFVSGILRLSTWQERDLEPIRVKVRIESSRRR